MCFPFIQSGFSNDPYLHLSQHFPIDCYKFLLCSRCSAFWCVVRLHADRWHECEGESQSAELSFCRKVFPHMWNEFSWVGNASYKSAKMKNPVKLISIIWPLKNSMFCDKMEYNFEFILPDCSNYYELTECCILFLYSFSKKTYLHEYLNESYHIM